MWPGLGVRIRPFSRPFAGFVTVPSASDTLLILLPTLPSEAAGPTPSSSQNAKPPAMAMAGMPMTPSGAGTIGVAAPPAFGTRPMADLDDGPQFATALLTPQMPFADVVMTAS